MSLRDSVVIIYNKLYYNILFLSVLSIKMVGVYARNYGEVPSFIPIIAVQILIILDDVWSLIFQSIQLILIM